MTENLIDIQEPDRSQHIIDLVERGLSAKGVALDSTTTLDGFRRDNWIGMANGKEATYTLPIPQLIPAEDIPSKAQDIIQSIEAAIRIARDPKGDEE